MPEAEGWRWWTSTCRWPGRPPRGRYGAAIPARFTPSYVANNGSHRFYGRDYPRRLRRAGLTPLRFDPLRGMSAAFRRRHGLKADARVYLAFASPAAAAAFARRARAGVSVPS